MQSFVEHIRAFVLSFCFTAFDQSETVPHMSLADLFSFVLNRCVGEEALQGEEARQSWTPIINKGSDE